MDTRTRELERLRAICPEVVAAALVGPDGEIFANSAQAELEDVVGPTTTTLTTIAQRAVQEMGRGALSTAVLDGSYGRIITKDVGDGSTLLVVAEPSARLGLLLDDVDACAAQLERSPAGELAHA